ncbi:MAG: alpha-rhamnosidase [Chitinophagaceae bacterium]|nr:alpha-rhamnosidase [Chitinophagaceae bacterium]
MQNRRTEKSTFFPVFWKMDNHYVLMDFHKVFDLKEAEEVNIYAEGIYNVKLDGKPLEGMPPTITVPAGKHKINVKVFCQASVPSVYIKGKTIVSDGTWLTTFEDKEWIDETGKTSDISATQWLNAGYWNFNDPKQPPSAFKLPVIPIQAAGKEVNGNSILLDFGKETFGFIKLHGLKGKGKLSVYYGESKEEALSREHTETFDKLEVNNMNPSDQVMSLSKAFRYVNIIREGNAQFDEVSMLYEYADLPDKGSFTCSDTLINKIYDVAKYTLHLSTREFFVDGIKRDRWIWSGDAYQSYLMNYYLMNDNATVTRTMYALRGKDPVTSHINTIMDYTFYWFLGIYDYYLYSGDKTFIQQNYGRMKSLMDYVLGRRNKNGLLEGLPGDWIFIDWAAGLSKKGEVSFEQLLFTRSLETMAICAEIVNDAENAGQYKTMAAGLRKKLFDLYWNEQKQALVHSRVEGKQTDNVTRYANMFSIFFDYFTDAQKQAVKRSVLLNDSIQKIVTPYMRFYELEALCAMGEQGYVLKEMKDYWGGMLKLGATSFWEEYNPSKKGVEHYAMYGREFGKSLCHAWGASPIYLMGKYYLGVKPTSAGYAMYEVVPNLGGLQWMQGKVPTPGGEIDLYVSNKQIKITGAGGTGIVKFKSKSKPICKEGQVTDKRNGAYELLVEKGKSYVVNYKL